MILQAGIQPRSSRRLVARRLWILITPVLAFVLNGCVYLPTFRPLLESHALAPSPDSRIARALSWQQANGSAKGRALIVDDAHFALTSRLELIDAADDALDLQYFIWQNDSSGILVIEKLLAAADRGVRVRVLVDDVQLEGLVNRLNAFEDHENIEVRIFNPFSVRWRWELGIWRVLEFVLDGNRLNHRMHNKLLVADNQLAIIGGRNIGDDYFGLSRARNFIDLDLLLSGPIVNELSAGFDVYWNSRWAYPVNEMLNLSLIPDQLDKIRKRIRKRLVKTPSLNVLASEQDLSGTMTRLMEAPIVHDFATVVDNPEIYWFEKPDQIAQDLIKIAERAEHEVLVVTPYLIPSQTLLDLSQKLTDKGVRISAVTNSLETNDVAIAQAAYARSRHSVLDTGVTLYEMRGDAELAADDIADEVSMHSKYIVFDERNVFMGSLNLDPRSLYLNTELGVMLDSPELAAQLRRYFAQLSAPQNSWLVERSETGTRWVAAGEQHKRTPAKSLWQRLRYIFFQLLPVSRQL